MKPLRCIAIDDDKLFLRTLSTYAQSILWLDIIGTYDHPVQGATAIVKEQPDVLFLDVDMPHVDGYALIDWLLPRLEKLPSLPEIVIISGNRSAIISNQHVTLALDKSQLQNEKQFERLLMPLWNRLQ